MNTCYGMTSKMIRTKTTLPDSRKGRFLYKKRPEKPMCFSIGMKGHCYRII